MRRRCPRSTLWGPAAGRASTRPRCARLETTFSRRRRLASSPHVRPPPRAPWHVTCECGGTMCVTLSRAVDTPIRGRAPVVDSIMSAPSFLLPAHAPGMPALMKTVSRSDRDTGSTYAGRQSSNGDLVRVLTTQPIARVNAPSRLLVVPAAATAAAAAAAAGSAATVGDTEGSVRASSKCGGRCIAAVASSSSSYFGVRTDASRNMPAGAAHNACLHAHVLARALTHTRKHTHIHTHTSTHTHR